MPISDFLTWRLANEPFIWPVASGMVEH